MAKLKKKKKLKKREVINKKKSKPKKSKVIQLPWIHIKKKIKSVEVKPAEIVKEKTIG